MRRERVAGGGLGGALQSQRPLDGQKSWSGRTGFLKGELARTSRDHADVQGPGVSLTNFKAHRTDLTPTRRAESEPERPGNSQQDHAHKPLPPAIRDGARSRFRWRVSQAGGSGPLRSTPVGRERSWLSVSCRQAAFSACDQPTLQIRQQDHLPGPGGPWFSEALPGKSKSERHVVSLHRRRTALTPSSGALNDIPRPASSEARP